MAQQPGIEAALRELVEAAVLSSGCELWDFSLSGTPPRQLLRVFVETPAGTGIEDCMRVSRALRPALDEAGEGFDRLDLEVSSPGAERRLRGPEDYRRFVGQRVNVRFRQEDSESVVEGILSAVDDAALTVVGSHEEETVVPLDQLAQARLAVDFGGGDKIGRRSR
ncbi:MAG: ribosome maturation factor RimP [Candidatus Dormibacteria bacterium]